MTTEAQYVVEQLTKLIGYTIEEVTVGDGGFPAILVRKRTRSSESGPMGYTFTRYWIDIQSDAEGNGPGWANVEEVKGGQADAAGPQAGDG